MDRRDLAIFREMWRDRIVWMGGWDRWISASEVARRLSLSTSTVSDRLRHWRSIGFIHGIKIFPNPRLLNVEFRSAHVFTSNPESFDAVERMLRLLPNLVHALEIETGFWTVWLDDGSDIVRRSLDLLATVPSAKIDSEIWPLNFPPPTRRALARDWKMIALLAREPEASPARLGMRLGISTKAASRRLERLVRSNLVFFHPNTDFTVTSGVVANLRIFLQADVDEHGVWRALEALDPVIAPQGDWDGDRLVTRHRLPENPAASYIALYWRFESAAQVWDRCRRIAKIEGVRTVVPQFVAKVWRGPSCIGDRLVAAAQSYGRPAARAMGPPPVASRPSNRRPGSAPDRRTGRRGTESRGRRTPTTLHQSTPRRR